MGIEVDGANQKLILDSDGDTYIEGATDDTLKVYVSGAEDLRIGANAINVLSGTTLTIDSGATITNSGTANGFGALAGIDDQSSSNDDQLTITDTAVVINEDSDDLDFRVESNGNANMLFVSGGNDVVGIGNEGDLGVGLHIKTADSSAPVHADQDELVIENSAHAGMTINSGASSKGSIAFSDSGGVSGVVKYDHSTDDLIFHTEDAENFRMSGKKISTGGESSADVDDGGITINHGANDANCFTLKNSDIAHGVTATAETDTYFKIGKGNSTLGGVEMTSFSEDIKALELGAMVGAVHTTKSTSGELAINARARLKDGTGSTDMSSNANLFGVSNRNTTVMIVDTEGEIHSDGGAQSAYDTYDDAQLVRAFDLSQGKGTINSKFDKFIGYNHEKLAELGIVGREEDGTPNHFINITLLQRLHNGAIWQQYEKHNQLLDAVYDLAKEAVGEEKANAILEKQEVKRLQ